jgi:hypothetical protein
MTHLRHQAQQSPILLENIPHIPNVEAVAIVQKDDLEAMEKKELIAMIDTLLNCKTNHNSHHRNKNKAVVVVPVPPKKSPLERSNHTPIPQQQSSHAHLLRTNKTGEIKFSVLGNNNRLHNN